MKQMHDLMGRILSEGFTHGDRTGVGRRSLYNVFLEFDASRYIPTVTTQKLFIETAAKELCWMLGGMKRIDNKGAELPIWKKWMLTEDGIDANRDLIVKRAGFAIHEGDDPGWTNAIVAPSYGRIGEVGRMYPQAWRSAPANNCTIRPVRELHELPSDFLEKHGMMNDFNIGSLNAKYWSSYDQINEMFLNMKARPYSSRHRVTAWIPEWIPDEDKDSQYNILNGRGSLTPCHDFFQFTVGAPDPETGKNTLNLLLHQGSCDVPVGGPYNVVCYTTLLHIFAHLLGMTPNKFSWLIGDAHIYTNQVELVKEQLTRPFLEQKTTLKILGEHSDPFSIKASDLVYEGYEHHEHLKYPVAV